MVVEKTSGEVCWPCGWRTPWPRQAYHVVLRQRGYIDKLVSTYLPAIPVKHVKVPCSPELPKLSVLSSLDDMTALGIFFRLRFAGSGAGSGAAAFLDFGAILRWC